MATFTKNFVEATPNTPILSSAWNENIGAAQERLQNHDHTEVGDNGPKIGISGLAGDVMAKFDEMQNSINTLTAKIEALEAQLAAVVVSPTPIITGFHYIMLMSTREDKPFVRPGSPVEIEGENFDTTTENNVVLFYDGKSILLEGTVTKAEMSKLKVTVPQKAKTGKVIVIVNGKTAISTSSMVIAP